MNKIIIPQMEPWFGDEEKKALMDYLDEGGWITEYKRTKLFEELIANYTRSKYCVVVNNGTISLTLAALACGIETGDDVIVPNYTMIATPNSIKMIGANPVFVDVEPETLCMDIDLVEKSITRKTKAIILVSANGRYPKSGISKLEALCIANKLVLIEDAAQALGSFYPDGRHIGSAGIIGSFSFSAPKIISTGQGGALISNSENISYRLERLKDFGRSKGGIDLHDTIGYNFKFTELQACIGIEQMKKLDWRVNRKKDIFSLYKKYLASINEIKIIDQDLKFTTPWFIEIICERRNLLQKYLQENGVGTRLMYPPINKQKAYQLAGTYPVSELIGEKGLWLPSSSKLSDNDIEKVCSLIDSFYCHG